MGCVLGRAAAGSGGDEAAAEPPKSETSRKVEQRPSSLAEAPEVGSVWSGRAEEEGSVTGAGGEAAAKPARERRRARSSLRGYPGVSSSGWPTWLTDAVGDAIQGLAPRRADTYEKLDKIGQGTYSNVYKAKDLITGKIVALKKVRFDNLEPESVKFMAREILVLRRLDHPNVIKLEGLVTSRMSSSLYLVFEYMEHDLAGLTASPEIKFTEPQVKCYINQLFLGLEHCHSHGVLHRDIKGSNLLIGNDGTLKIADFGLASFFDPNKKQPMTSRVITLWYRPPELLLGATTYGVEVDLWSAGCILAELLAGKPIMPGRTEVEQLHKIYKLCGSPSEEYWKRLKLPHATLFKPQHAYKRCVKETFRDFSPPSLSLVDTLLAIDPAERGTVTASLQSEFFNSEPYACEPSSLPQYPPSKEMDAKLREEESRRQRGMSGKNAGGEGSKKVRVRDRGNRAVPAPEANAELQINLDRRRHITHGNAKSKSEKFPPPHQDGAVGFPLDSSRNALVSFTGTDNSFNASFIDTANPQGVSSSRPLGQPKANGGFSWRKKSGGRILQFASSRAFLRTFRPSSFTHAIDLRRGTRKNSQVKGTPSAT